MSEPRSEHAINDAETANEAPASNEAASNKALNVDESAKDNMSEQPVDEGSKPTDEPASGDAAAEVTRPGSQKSVKSSGSKDGKIPSPVMSAKDNPASDLRNMRRVIAEDPEWSLATVPLLAELCVQHIVDNFENNSKIINDLLPKHKAAVLEKISTDLPIKITANLIDDEGYWKRRCNSKWNICDVAQYGHCWKRMFFERNLQRIIENFVPDSTDPTELNETLVLSGNYVKKLVVRQLLPPVKDITKANMEADDASEGEGSEAGDGPDVDHFDFGTIFPQLPFLEDFSVTYSVRDCGMNFEWNLFQFTARDCLLLAKCIAACKHLKVFRLHRSKVDCDKVRVLISHILDHPGLVELDLSHNIISDRGARAIGKFINNHSQLVKLDLCDNNIRPAGAQAIAHALTKNTTLTDMNLRMNRLTDDGGQAICRALLKNSTLKHVNLGSNDLTEPTAAILSQVVVQNSTLKTLDLSCNRLGPDGGKQLQEGMEENETITELDMRLTESGQESEYSISQILDKNREKEREKLLNSTKQG